LPEGVSGSDSGRGTEGECVMKQLLCEPVELTEVELDAVSGGLTITIGASGGSTVGSGVGVKFIVKSEPITEIENVVDQSVNVSFSL
jgi:hypothetical protein